MKTPSLLLNVFSTVALSVAICANAAATQLAPPVFQVIDKFGINVPNGQITHSVDTVAIGGELGLKHKISSHTSNFLTKGGTYSVGLNDGYKGGARYELVKKANDYFLKSQLGCSADSCDYAVYFMRVHDYSDSAEFVVKYNGYTQGNAYSRPSGYTYQAVKDTRHTLTIPQSGYLLWTKPDGTEVTFYRGSGATAGTPGSISKIVFPNGFTLNYTYHPGTDTPTSITTNTGYQLKYNYLRDNTGNLGIGAGNTELSNPPENTLNWSLNNPWSVVGINTTENYCSTSLNQLCVGQQNSCPSVVSGQSCSRLSKQWPTARFEWPKGMPRAFYFLDSSFKVTDANGAVTEFKTKPFDTALTESGARIGPVEPGKFFVPRLREVFKPGSTTPAVTYRYQTLYGGGSFFNYSYTPVTESAYIHRAEGMLGDQYYSNQTQASNNPYHMSANGAHVSVETRADLIGAITKVINQDRTMYFEETYRNFLSRATSSTEPEQRFRYDSRNNLDRIDYKLGQPDATYIEADYPNTCSNRKTCNQATWVSDAKGNRTYYTYHSHSGQVASVTSPADAQGLKAQTRYEYAQFNARYKNTSGAWVTGSPVWLKTAEKYCINSNYVSGSCQGNDEVVTRFYYDTNKNLNLTESTITDPGTGKIQRTCFQYDRYGNLIGEVQPKGAVSSCNI